MLPATVQHQLVLGASNPEAESCHVCSNCACAKMRTQPSDARCPAVTLAALQGSSATRSASGTALRSVSRPEIPGAELPLPLGLAGRTIATLSVGCTIAFSNASAMHAAAASARSSTIKRTPSPMLQRFQIFPQHHPVSIPTVRLTASGAGTSGGAAKNRHGDAADGLITVTLQAAAASEEALALKSVRSNTGSTQSSRAASLSSVSSLGSPVASAANPYALFALRPEPATLARFSTGECVSSFFRDLLFCFAAPRAHPGPLLHWRGPRVDPIVSSSTV
jgi:hypothetical protein